MERNPDVSSEGSVLENPEAVIGCLDRRAPTLLSSLSSSSSVLYPASKESVFTA